MKSRAIGCVLLSATAAVFAADPLSQAPARAAPRLEFVQAVKNGADGVTKMAGGISSVQVNGKFLYVSASQPAQITWFKRDLESGKLAYAGDMEIGQRLFDAYPKFRTWGYGESKGCILAFAAGRMYAIPHGGTAMAWYDIDAETGRPIERGLVACPPCWQAVVTPDQRHLYVKTSGYPRRNVLSVLWFKLGDDGKPVQSGEATGKGTGATPQCCYPSLLELAPDGKHIYSLSTRDMAVACIERKATGEIAYKSAVDLTPIATTRPEYYHWGSLAITPDGNTVYAGMWGYGKTGQNAYGIYKRNIDTGELTLRERIGGEKLGGILKGWNVTFLPDGSGGYWGSTVGPGAFTRDAETGRLAEAAALKEARSQAAGRLALDRDNGFLYAGSTGWDCKGDVLYVIKAAKASAKPSER